MAASVLVQAPLEPFSESHGLEKSAAHSISPATEDDSESSIHTIDGLVRQRARLYPHTHVVSYPSSGTAFVDYTLQQLDVFAWRAARIYEADVPARLSSALKPAVVVLLGPSNLEYLVTMLALAKLGHTVLLLSTRIPQPAVESLLESTGAEVLIADQAYLDLASAVQAARGTTRILEFVQRDSFEFPIQTYVDTRLDRQLDPEVEKNNIIWIIHSSGSTGLPKPIYQSQKSCIPNYAMNMEMKALITLPLFHNHGICNVFRAIYARKSIHLYNADLPLTSHYLVSIMRQTQFEIFYGVPYALKLLSESQEGIDLMRQLKVVMYGGSACPDDLGNLLVDNGVNLVGHYGATEVGQLMTSFRPPGDKVWNYVREHDRLSPYLNWIPRGPNLYECSVSEGWPAKVQSNQPDGSYTTKDLFEPHPTIPKAWKYIARLDDTLVLVNGEKFSPVAMEGRLRSNRHIAEAVVFGAGRPYLGVLVVPAVHQAGPEATPEDTLNAIWEVVETANRDVDAFARISKEMVRILPADCSYPRTDKGSIIRQAFYKAFKAEIDEAYDEQDGGSTEHLPKLDLPELRDLVRGVIAKSLSLAVGDLKDDTDFFALGLDSLQALQIRSRILKTVNLGEGRKALGQNVVFEQSTVEKLSRFLFALSSGQELAETTPVEDEMNALIGQYSLVGGEKPGSVIITGATGSLGAHVASQLSARDDISKIYCLVRAPDAARALRRVKSSLIQRKIYHSMTLSSRRKIIALPSDFAEAKLGLSDETYDAISQDLRSVIHCAWSVNFNMKLSSFESNILGVRNLIDLCKNSMAGASMNFCSSVSACARSTVDHIPEALPPLEWAQGMGYAQSKSVSEHICAAAAQQGVRARVLRVGQIIGDTQHGVWNAQEAVPMMMQTAVTVGVLPRLQESPSWLPVDTVAQACVDVALSETNNVFVNISHPKTFNFVEDLLPALRESGLQFTEAEPQEWVRKLRSSSQDPQTNPPIKLADFFASKYDKTEFAPSKTFATDVACSLSPALAEAPLIGPTLVKKFVDYFLQNAWRQQSTSPKIQKTAIFMAGPCGTGKTTAGKAIADYLQVPFIEGDSLHSKPAIEKMRSAQPLSDGDRWPWLERVSSHAAEALEDLSYDSVVVSCSALKRSYRSQLRESLASRGMRVLFLDLQADSQTLTARLAARTGHYMRQDLVDGQLETYEAAGPEETDVFPVDAATDEKTVLEEIMWLLEEADVAKAA